MATEMNLTNFYEAFKGADIPTIGELGWYYVDENGKIITDLPITDNLNIMQFKMHEEYGLAYSTLTRQPYTESDIAEAKLDFILDY